MTVTIDSAHLANLIASGTENNPVVGIDSVFNKPGTLLTGGSTNVQALDGATYTYWVPAAANSSITIDLSESASADMAGIASHNLGGTGYEVLPEYWNGSTWVAASDGVTPTTDETIVWLFDSIASDQWRMRVISGTGDDYVIGVVFIGRRITFDQTFYQGYNPARTPTNVELLVNSSGPHIIGTSIIGRGSQVEWSLEHLPEADTQTADFATWIDAYNGGTGFFTAWRPADYNEAYYGYRAPGASPIQIINSGPTSRKSLDFAMSVYHE